METLPTSQICLGMQADTDNNAGQIRRATCARSERGVTLVEALITLLVMSIGLLGIAAMQVIGIQENASALRHSQATWLAYEIADRMRANLPGVANGYYGTVGNPASTATAADCSSGTCNCEASTANCSYQDMALYDIYQWRQGLMPTASTGGLPGGVGTIEDMGGGRLRVRVMWDESAREVRSDSDNLVLNVRGCPSDLSITRTCMELWVQP